MNKFHVLTLFPEMIESGCSTSILGRAKEAGHMGRKVPEVLLSGHHGRIEEWRKEQSYLRTKERRPDLLDKNK